MADPSLREWREEKKRLLRCLEDVPGIPQAFPIAMIDADQHHRDLFKVYIGELEVSTRNAQSWFDRMLDFRQERDRKTRKAVIESTWLVFPAGPASDPQFISLIRKFWLECDKTNNNLDRNRRVMPQFFILSWLVEQQLFEMVKYVCYLPYWPIGLDENGNWC